MNKLTIIGNSTSDAQLRSTQAGVSVCTFTVAVNPKYKKEGQQNDAQFFRVTAWRKLGENCGKFIRKGMKVCVVGSVSLQSFEGNDGNTRYSLAVDADDVEFLSRVDGEGSAPTQKTHQEATQQDYEPQSDVGSYTDVTEDLGELPF